MNSKEQIKYDLEQIANSHNLSGEAIDLIIDLLTYSLYHEQIEIMNTAKEMSLNDAALINSKISLCCNNMYSVYRGKNPRILIKPKLASILSKDKFDKIYESNSFKVYASNAFVYNPTQDDIEIEGIISKSEIIDINHKITKDDIYYLDLKDSSNKLYSDLSEDIIVSILEPDGEYTEYKTTRIFSDHCRSVGENESIFVLTIPDYGIRLFKRNKFSKDDIVNVKILKFTSIDDINESELNKIVIPGTTTKVYDESTGLNYKLINEVPRQNTDSLLYEVNSTGRVNHEIQSNSDVAYLFSEVFIDKVLDSTYDYYADPSTRTNDRLTIYYISRPEVELNEYDISNFKINYCPYFINDNVFVEPANEIPVTMDIEVITDDTTSIQDGIDTILSEYNYKLNTKLNRELLVSQISRISHVKYVNNLVLNSDEITDFKSGSGLGSYYVITANITFLSE